MVRQRIANPLHVGSNPILTSEENQAVARQATTVAHASFAVSFAVGAPDTAAVQAAIDRLTRALATAADDVIPALVAERAALRAELRALREEGAGIARLADQRAR